MKFNPLSLATWLPAAICSLLLLSACAPTATGPSSALRQQFETIMQQQQQQAVQLQALQDQLAQLQLSGAAPAGTQMGSGSEPITVPSYTADTPKISVYTNTEIAAVADSASTYLKAFSNLAAGRFAPAEAGFDHFLRKYPEHQYTPNARYWLASAQVSQSNLQAAMSNLRQIVVASDGQKKAPAALVLLAQIYRQQELQAEAEDVLEQLRSRYPDSPEAQHFYQSDEPK